MCSWPVLQGAFCTVMDPKRSKVHSNIVEFEISEGVISKLLTLVPDGNSVSNFN